MPDPGLPTLFAQTAKLPLLTRKQEIDLAERRDRGEPGAVKKLVEHNIRLSVWRAKRWQGRGLDYEDLIQEGVFGLERAAQKFQHDRGIAFSTYAVAWVDHFMGRAVSREDIVPYSVRRRRQKADELMKAGSSMEDVCTQLNCTEGEVVEALDSGRAIASLDGDLSQLYEHLANFSADDDDDPTVVRVRHAVAGLPRRAREYVEVRFGLGPDEGCNRTEAAKRCALKLREAQELEAKATAALREELDDLSKEIVPERCTDLPPEDLEFVCHR